ncbi:MAG: DNA polymerase, partial [Rickettsiales bacterium]|nr:DNA polymerase [Rickettsiales bacterium]
STTTGRLSSINPNLQNIPIKTEEGRRIRKAFIAEEGKVLIGADYSQIELMLLAEIANIPSLKKAFLDGKDIHQATASEVFGVDISAVTPELRRNAKAVNFGIIYGQSAFGLANQLKISRVEAKNIIDRYFARYPEIRVYMDKTIEFARKNGFVQTIFGRRIYLPNINDKNHSIRAFQERASINAPLQGSSADIIKLAMIKINQLNLQAKPLLQIHDELIFETPQELAESEAKIIKSTMQEVAKLSIPLIVDAKIGNNWAEIH